MSWIQNPLRKTTFTAAALLALLFLATLFWRRDQKLIYRLPAPVLGTQAYEGRIRWYFSPDTFEIVDRQGTTHMVRLVGADCPEPNQAQSSEATRFVRDRIVDKALTVQVEFRDHRNVEFALVRVDQKDLALNLLDRGLAWYVAADFSNQATFRAAESSARAAKRGIWGENQPTPPWEVRGRRWDDDEAQVRAILSEMGHPKVTF